MLTELLITEDLIRDALACEGVDTTGMGRRELVAAWNAAADRNESRMAAELAEAIDFTRPAEGSK